MLRLKFDSKLDFQISAINSVVDLFKGQTKRSFDYTFQIIPNILDLPREKILENLQVIQNRNGLHLSNIKEWQQGFRFSVVL